MPSQSISSFSFDNGSMQWRVASAALNAREKTKAVVQVFWLI
jgi:hypothetical protein